MSSANKTTNQEPTGTEATGTENTAPETTPENTGPETTTESTVTEPTATQPTTMEPASMDTQINELIATREQFLERLRNTYQDLATLEAEAATRIIEGRTIHPSTERDRDELLELVKVLEAEFEALSDAIVALTQSMHLSNRAESITFKGSGAASSSRQVETLDAAKECMSLGTSKALSTTIQINKVIATGEQFQEQLHLAYEGLLELPRSTRDSLIRLFQAYKRLTHIAGSPSGSNACSVCGWVKRPVFSSQPTSTRYH
ncbi:hypothetical protein GE09DRAFT_1062184 [Coniochaeta sp. 2T2.1]|nr:hypothetical protein GE09DRAFT_1062184 [Coniochaeta sp. 2T2.1]